MIIDVNLSLDLGFRTRKGTSPVSQRYFYNTYLRITSYLPPPSRSGIRSPLSIPRFRSRPRRSYRVVQFQSVEVAVQGPTTTDLCDPTEIYDDTYTDFPLSVEVCRHPNHCTESLRTLRTDNLGSRMKSGGDTVEDGDRPVVGGWILSTRSDKEFNCTERAL